MGDSGEGLVDTHDRLAERLEERKKQNEPGRHIPMEPEKQRLLESLRLARIEMERQWNLASTDVRRQQVKLAIEEIDRRMDDLQKP